MDTDTERKTDRETLTQRGRQKLGRGRQMVTGKVRRGEKRRRKDRRGKGEIGEERRGGEERREENRGEGRGGRIRER